MTLAFILIIQVIRAVELYGTKKNLSAPTSDPAPNPAPVSKTKSKSPVKLLEDPNKSLDSYSRSLSMNQSNVYDRQNKKYIHSGGIISLTSNGPAMFYLLEDNTIEVCGQPANKVFETNLENPSQIFAFQQKLYAIDNHRLYVAAKQNENTIKFVLVPFFSSLTDITYISGREDLFAICRYNEDPYFEGVSGIYTYQFDGKKTIFLGKIEGAKYFYGYDRDIYAVLDNNHNLVVNNKNDQKTYSGVKTMAFDKDNEPIIINTTDNKTREIDSFFGNVYMLKDV